MKLKDGSVYKMSKRNKKNLKLLVKGKKKLIERLKKFST